MRRGEKINQQSAKQQLKATSSGEQVTGQGLMLVADFVG
jgi:hypothetical protein